MGASSTEPLLFGNHKYIAFNLLLARWARAYAQGAGYQYVTLGGTELRDIAYLEFVDSLLTVGAVSYEADRERFKLAEESAVRMRATGKLLSVRNEDFFQYRRTADIPHLFFLDLEGMCLSCHHADFPRLF